MNDDFKMSDLRGTTDEDDRAKLFQEGRLNTHKKFGNAYKELAKKSRRHDEDLANRLTEARKNAGLTQNQAAMLVNRDGQFVSQTELCKRKVSAEDLTAFASAYSVSVGWLLGEVTEGDLSGEIIAMASKLPDADRMKLLRIIASLPGDR